MRWQPHRLFLVSFLMTVGTFANAADDDDAKKEASARRLVAMKAEIDKFELTIGDGKSKALVRLDEPVQRWNNPIVPVVDATVFLWTHNGRPAVIAQLAEVPSRGLCIEAHSLTAEPVVGQFRGDRWAPTPPGVKWLSASTDEVPAATAELRRIQMRTIAERYQVTDLFDNKRNELRLIPRPLYRYSALEAGILDGALFSFALGTDPEAIIMVESQKEAGVDTWKVAFARMTGYACEAKLDGKEIWSCRPGWPYPPTSAFFQPK